MAYYIKPSFLAVLVYLLLPLNVKGQQEISKPYENSENRFFSDFIMGPYLFIGHIRYESVFLKGARLGYELDKNLAVALEYLAGHQDDIQNQLGTTHHVSLQLDYFLTSKKSKFRPYAYAGGGFLEFKDFSKDQFGIGIIAGLGSEMNIKPWLKTTLDFRYLNIANFGFDAQSEIGILWGARLYF